MSNIVSYLLVVLNGKSQILLVKSWKTIGNHTVQDSEFLSCVCVYSKEKVCPVYLYHHVYFVDRNFLVHKYIFS